MKKRNLFCCCEGNKVLKKQPRQDNIQNMHLLKYIDNNLYATLKENFPKFSIYHSKEWHTFLYFVFGWQVKGLIEYKNNGEIIFFTPIIKKHRLLKPVFISLPLSHYVPPLHKKGYDFNDLAKFLNEKIDVSNIEFNANLHVSQITDKKFYKDERNKTIILDLLDENGIQRDQKKIFRLFNKNSIQRKIKKANKTGIVVENEFSLNSMEKFVDMQIETRRRQGSLMYPSSFFSKLFSAFKETDHIRQFTAYYDGKNPVAGVIFAYYGKVAIYLYGASFSSKHYLRNGVNQIVMWEAIKEAINRRCHIVDFGKTPLINKGLLDYKKKWGGKVSDLDYTIYNANVAPKRSMHAIKKDGRPAKYITEGLKLLPKPVFKTITPIGLRVML